MKYNKWTVALAALGVVSHASAAKAEEKASPVMTALSSTTISGYVDTSAEWNFGTGNGQLPPYKFNSPSKADGFNLDVVQLRIDKPLDEGDWAAGYRADFWFGPDANTLGTQSTGSGNDFAIRQAYVALRAPVGSGLDFKMGVFDSIIGYESVEAGNNPNFTRSYGHSIEPQTETGLLASYRFCDMFSASVGVADTTGPAINDRAFAPLSNNIMVLGQTGPQESYAESYKTYMGSIALTAPDSMGFLSGSTLYAGIVNGFLDNGRLGSTLTVSPTPNTHPANSTSVQTSYYVGATVATPVTGLRMGASFDYIDVANVSCNDYSVAGYLSYQATEKLSFHARAELFRDKIDNGNGGQELLFGAPNGTANSPVIQSGETGAHVMSLTGTVQYDLWKNVISRLELRWDHSLAGNALFGQPDAFGVATSQNAIMLAANVIYKF